MAGQMEVPRYLPNCGALINGFVTLSAVRSNSIDALELLEDYWDVTYVKGGNDVVLP